MGKSIKKNHLAWIDMEMTGLDPEKEVVLEIASLVTDKDLNVIAEGPELVVKQSARYLNRMDAWNTGQHTKSGLVDKVKNSKVTLKQAEDKTLQFVKKYCTAGEAYLCGNVVHHDRRFMAKYMPRLHKFFHYRLIDVSTIKVLVELWYAKKYDKQPVKSNKHRALPDIYESVQELKYYKKAIFKKMATKKSAVKK